MRIDEALLNEAKAHAARQGRSLNSVVEDALRQLLNRSAEAAQRPRVELPISDAEPGYTPYVAARLARGDKLEHIVWDLDDHERFGLELPDASA